MGKKRKKVVVLLVLLFFLLWFVLAQFTMKFREPDDKAKKEFAGLGVTLAAKTIQANDFNLHYVQVGSDTMPTIFFVHGSPGSWIVFKRYLQDKDLLNHYRMISVDRPGFGYSEFGNVKTLEEQSAIISHLLHFIQNNKPIFLVGHSLGGPLIVKLYIDNPHLVSGLIILAGSLDPRAEKREPWRRILFKTPLNYLIPGAWRPSNHELWYLKNDLKVLDQNLYKVTCPVWVVHGTKDHLVPFSNVAYIKDKFRNAEDIHIQVLQNANHFIPWTHFIEIKQVLLSLPL